MNTNIKVIATIVLLSLIGCAGSEKKQDKTTVKTPDEISLKQDRSELDSLRKDISPELQEANDEWALILKDMDGVKTPFEVRSRYYEKTRRTREKFNDQMRKAREDYNKKEQRDRKEFLDGLDKERKDFDKKASADKKKAFWEDHSDRRKIFFEEQNDKRKEFDSMMNQRRKDTDEYLKDRQKQFEDAIREYTKNFDSKIKEKRQLEGARQEALKSKAAKPADVGYPGRDQDLQDINSFSGKKGQPLAPEDD